MAEQEVPFWESDKKVGDAGSPQESVTPKFWENDDLANQPSGPSERIEAVSQGVVSGASEFGPIAAGAFAGAKTGMAAGAPFGPVGVGVGGAVGLGAGIYSGYKAGSALNEVLQETENPITGNPLAMRPEQQPDDLKPFAMGGETLGGGMIGSGVTLGAAKAGFRAGNSIVGRFVNKIMDSAKHTPGTFLAAETAGNVGASVLGGVSQAVVPDNAYVRFIAEAAGGMFSPTRLFITSNKAATSIFSRLRGLSPFGSEASRMDDAANVLGELMEQFGEDPVLLKQALIEEGLVDTSTAAQKTGSVALTALENKLASLNTKFGVDVAEASDATYKNLADIVSTLKADTGNPASLKAAAELESLRFKTLIQNRVKAAENEVFEAASRLKEDTPAARGEISRLANDALSGALEDSRLAESGLWDAIPTNIDVDVSSIRNDILAFADAEMIPGQTLPKEVNEFLKRVKRAEKLAKAGKDVPDSLQYKSGEVVKLRKVMLGLHREALKKNNLNDARVYGHVAEAILDAGDSNLNSIPEYNEARAFSKQLNDTFYRTFSAQGVEFGANAGAKVPPEELLMRALAGGKERGEVRFRELEEATRFMQTQTVIDTPSAREFAPQMMEAQERFLQVVAAEAVDPQTGAINAKRLAGFLDSNGEVLKRFPALREQLQEAVKSSESLDKFLAMQRGATPIIQKTAAFSKISKFDNPAKAVAEALAADNPATELSRLVKFAKKSPEAMDGFRASVLSAALTKSTKGGAVDFDALREILFAPVDDGAKSVMEMLKDSGGADDAFEKLLLKVLDTADTVKKGSLVRGVADIDSLQTMDMLSDLIMRSGGSVAATSAARTVGVRGSGPSLVIAQAGSRQAQRLLDKMPKGKVSQVLTEASLNPELMAMLLARPRAAKAKYNLIRQLHGYLYASGYFAVSEDIEEQE